MALVLIGYIIQTKNNPGFSPNSTTVSFDDKGPVAHVFYSRNQARDVLNLHERGGNLVEDFAKTIDESVLPEASATELVRLDGAVANELIEAMLERGHLPEGVLVGPGIFQLTGPSPFTPDDPYVMCAVNGKDGKVSIYAFASTQQFDDIVARHADIMEQEYVDAARLTLLEIGMPETSDLKLVHIDGLAAEHYGHGLHVRRYRHMQAQEPEQGEEEPIPDTQRSFTADADAVRLILAANVPPPTVGAADKARMSAMLFFKEAQGQSLAVFYSKRQGISLVAESKHKSIEDHALELITASALPDASRKKVVMVKGHAAKTLYDAFGCHATTPIGDEERAHDAQLGRELLDPFLPMMGQEPDAMLGIMLSPREHLVHVCKSKQQMHRLLKKHADLIGIERKAQLKKGVDGSLLPARSDEPIVTIEDTAASILYRGLRLLWLRHRSN